MGAPSMHVRLSLIHGVLQRIANEAGVRILHIKGPAVATELLDTRLTMVDGEPRRVPVPRNSSDADVLVHPADVRTFLKAVRGYGWQQKTSFRAGSAFGHAANIYHPHLGNADIHRFYPGLPADAFNALWANRDVTTLGNVKCPVPALTEQRLLLLLHGARSGPHHPDIDRAWGRATAQEREEVRRLAADLGAHVGLAAAVDELERFKDHPEYLLWKHFRTADPRRLDEWRARWRAARTVKAKVMVLVSLVLFHPSSLESDLGHRPTKMELIKRNVARWGTMIKEVGANIRAWGNR